jgi:hypothetical protein
MSCVSIGMCTPSPDCEVGFDVSLDAQQLRQEQMMPVPMWHARARGCITDVLNVWRSQGPSLQAQTHQNAHSYAFQHQARDGVGCRLILLEPDPEPKPLGASSEVTVDIYSPIRVSGRWVSFVAQRRVAQPGARAANGLLEVSQSSRLTSQTDCPTCTCASLVL